MNGQSQLRILQVRCGNQDFYLELGGLREILREAEVRPNRDATFPHGWISYAGEAVPVVDLNALLKSETGAQNVSQRWIVLTVSGQMATMQTAITGQVLKVPGESFTPLPANFNTVTQNWFAGFIRLDNRHQLLLDPQRILGLTTVYPSENQPKKPQPEKPAHPQRQSGGLLKFKLDHRVENQPWWLGLPLGQIAEYQENVHLQPLPGTRPFVGGYTSWRGRAVPVIDMARRLGLQSGQSGKSSCLICKLSAPDQYAGLLISHHPDLSAAINQYRPSARPFPWNRHWIYGVYEHEEGPMAVLQLDALLNG